MTEQEIRKKYAGKRLEIKRRREWRKRIITGFLYVCFTVLMACGIGLFCRHLLLRRTPGELPAVAVTAAEPLQAAVQTQAENDPTPRWNTNELTDLRLVYSIFVYDMGWNMPKQDNSFCMASLGYYATAMNIRIENQVAGMTGTIEYSVNVSGDGWQDWVDNGSDAGLIEGDKPLEAFRARFSGELGEYYDIYYSVLQDNSWTEWVSNGEDAGVTAAGKRVDGIRLSCIKKADKGIRFPGGVDPSKPMVALTYDDGPSRVATPRILETLERYDARATFFMVGSRVPVHGDIVRQMWAQGSEVANHTMNHVAMKRQNGGEYAQELTAANQALMNACGVAPVLMRPCEGYTNSSGLDLVGSLGMSSILWTVDTLDWKTRDAQKTTEAVLNNVKDGDIILMHDLYESTADASEEIIPELISRGYQLVTVSEMAASRGGILPGQNYGSFR